MRNKLKTFVTFAFAILLLFSTQIVAFAEDPPKLGATNVTNIVNKAASTMELLVIFASLGMGIFGGYMWIFSAGDPQKIKQAQGILTWTILGVVFYVLIGLLINTFKNLLT